MLIPAADDGEEAERKGVCVPLLLLLRLVLSTARGVEPVCGSERQVCQ